MIKFRPTLLALALATVLPSYACVVVVSVPAVKDPKNIVINGVSMTPQTFLQLYCKESDGHDSCVKVAREVSRSGSRSKTAPARP